jgi:hypothetical protein
MTQSVRIDKGEPVLSKIPRKAEPPALRGLEKEIADRLEPVLKHNDLCSQAATGRQESASERIG